MKSPKFWTILIILLATTFVLESRGDTDRLVPTETLSHMPQTFGGWTSTDLPLADDVLEVLGKGVFLNRLYNTPNRTAPVSLFIGYFPTQRTGQTMHSPQNCLPGAGWTFDSKKYVDLTDVNGKTYRVGEYLISNADTKQFVIYWYQAHGRSIPNEYLAKLYMVTDAIRTNRTDGAIVRIITPVMPGEPTEAAEARAVDFTRQMAPNLSRFIPN
jgi:EpsI family protein